ncbi:MAG TPA: hypothetical protein DCX14_04220 [Flavobacteriales bacterium]|nr:hypothetical protein [Flavobacteriales bacterium]
MNKKSKPAPHKRRSMVKPKKPVKMSNGRLTNYAYDTKAMIEALPSDSKNPAQLKRGIVKAEKILTLSYLNKTETKKVEGKIRKMEKAIKGNEKKKS